MRFSFSGLVLTTVLSTTGCSYYVMPRSLVERAQALPPTERSHAVVAATREADQASVLVRADRVRWLDDGRPTIRARSPAKHPALITGIALLGAGAALMAGGIAVALTPVDTTNCRGDNDPSCSFGAGFAHALGYGLLLGFGGAHLLAGTVAAVVGGLRPGAEVESADGWRRIE